MNDKERMRKLKVDRDELAFALENASWEIKHYLGLQTGRVISIPGDTYRELEDIYEEAYDPEAEEAIGVAELVRQLDTMEWHKQALLEANEIETNAARYLSIPGAEPYEAYNDMEDFIYTVRDERLQDRLFWAIRGRGLFVVLRMPWLATLGRKLNGHVQSFGRGGEVFLANPQGDYLGRTCPWKQCGPGIRASCDARHCGRRPYLHDDWDAIQLAPALIAAPPVGLWPQAVARVPVPDDLETGLIADLRKG